MLVIDRRSHIAGAAYDQFDEAGLSVHRYGSHIFHTNSDAVGSPNTNTAEGDPYYPIPRPEKQALYKRYETLADALPETWFVGRLATYRYVNMDQVVGQALATFSGIENLGRMSVAGRAA